MIPIYIGYDDRQAIAYHICCNSILRHSSVPVRFIPLKNNLFVNTNKNDSSTTFNYLRFLVPYLENYKGWSIYLDSDILVLDDIGKLYDLRNKKYSVMVAKHNYKTKFNKKFFSNNNKDYPRKNWSSVMLWNNNKNKNIDINFVLNNNGSFLHRFTWLEDNKIGSLPLEWNWLVKEYNENTEAKILHYTIGIPDFFKKDKTFSSIKWYEEKNKLKIIKNDS